ncbi:MAG TPA: hypothetical protein VJR29_14365 [bacterium]|nr:hypothetical protein [bacterium]
MGLFDLFEEIFDGVMDFFGDSEDTRRARPPQGQASPSAMSASAAQHQEGYWEKTSQLITPEFLDRLARETGLSTLKLSMKIQGPCSEVLQRWQHLGRPITDADLETMRQEIRGKILPG